jgi:hypothetical protein
LEFIQKNGKISKIVVKFWNAGSDIWFENQNRLRLKEERRVPLCV